jgi:predicted TIM-barrel fold metal-dependent hydrolase
MSTDNHIPKKKRPRSRRSDSGMLKKPLPAIKDPEGDRVPEFLPPVVDAHVHLFPDNYFAKIWHWFDDFGWPIRYKMTSPDAIRFLLSRGIEHIVGLHYAHKSGIAQKLNSYMAKLCRNNNGLTGLATVMPGEENASGILEEAFQLGLAGVKLHAHVQCIDVSSPAMHEIYESCTELNKPLLIHAGREPKSPGYQCDPHTLCSASKLERVIKAYPDLRICVPHLGADEFEAYQKMLDHYDNLWLDTTMTLADYLPLNYFPDLSRMRPDRIIFGTDFPSLPYAWDRELKRLSELGLSDDSLALILGENAKNLYSIKDRHGASRIRN